MRENVKVKMLQKCIFELIYEQIHTSCILKRAQPNRAYAEPEMHVFLTSEIPSWTGNVGLSHSKDPSSEGRARVAGPDPACPRYTNGALSVSACVGDMT